jgi:3-oxoacyl-[acyl-carrier-protein] synthase-3
MNFRHVRIESLAHVIPPHSLTSEAIEARLAPVYEALKLPVGRLELMTGIESRHYWERDTLASEASAFAGEKVLQKSRFDRASIELIIHAGVCRDRLEPATAAFVHQRLGLSGNAQILDVSNACLGFANAMVLAASMIESGSIRRALIVSGENGLPLIEQTLLRLLKGDLTRQTIKPYFANLTIGAGAAAMMLCHASETRMALPELRFAAGYTDTSHNHLCQGDRAVDGNGLEMQTDAEALLNAGLEVGSEAFRRFSGISQWTPDTPDHFVCHQVGRTHQRKLFEALGLDLGRDIETFPFMGNVGSVSLPLTLSYAAEKGLIHAGQRVCMMGIGSGLSSLILGVEWK